MVASVGCCGFVFSASARTSVVAVLLLREELLLLGGADRAALADITSKPE
jgi:hypothetical protein